MVLSMQNCGSTSIQTESRNLAIGGGQQDDGFNLFGILGFKVSSLDFFIAILLAIFSHLCKELLVNRHPEIGWEMFVAVTVHVVVSLYIDPLLHMCIELLKKCLKRRDGGLNVPTSSAGDDGAEIGIEASADSMIDMSRVEKTPEMKTIIGEDDSSKMLGKVNETISWLGSNQTAEKEIGELEHHQKDLDSVCNPIMTKLYASATTAASAGGGSGAGPTIEEVD